jgi:hypothetical protein
LRGMIGAITAAAALCLSAADAKAFDQSKYPNFKGQWHRIGPPRWDPSDRDGTKAPLTPEYQAIHEANLKDQAEGGQGTDPTFTCLAPGMPRIMNMYDGMEIVVTPDTTHVLIQHIHDSRRIYTDGRDWPAEPLPSFAGYSIGKWIDIDGDGRYDVLEVETRHLKGPRSYDSSGLPLHSDNLSVIKERLYLDKADPDLLLNEITVIDNALTRPWTVLKKAKRDPSPQPAWREVVCAENNNHLQIGNDNYMLSADGYLMPAKKGQKPPDFRYFKQAGN